MKEVRILSVDAGEDGVRLDRWFKRRWPHLNHVQIQKLTRSGQIRVDGGRAKPDTRLTGGAQVRVPPLPEAPEPGERADRGLDAREAAYAKSLVLFEDDEVLVLNKPAGLAVQGGTKTHKHIDRLLSAWGEGLERPRLVHRLDRDTSGVMVVARGPQAAAALRAQFQARSVEKRYLALVRGKLSAAEGLIDAPIGRHPGMRQRMAVLSGGREAQTRYRVLLEWPGISWIEAFPRTGRTHQIRVHLASIGHPVLSDPVYGLPDPRIGRQALHASRISLDHPQSGERLSFEAPLPADLAAALEGLGLPEG